MFKKYSTKDGLLSNTIRSICQTKNGNWLVATNNGVQQFNGYSFTTIYSNPQTSSICSFIKEDREENLWIFETNKTLVLQHSKASAIEINAAKGNPNFILNNLLTPIIEDQNYMWCWAKNGIYGIDKIKFSATIFLPVSIENLSDRFLPCISTGDNGVSWISGHTGAESFLIRFKPGEKIQINTYQQSPNGLIKGCIAINDKENLVIGTQMTSICKHTDLEHPLKIISKKNIPGSYLRNFSFEKLQVFDSGNFLFAGDTCIYMYDVLSKTIRPYIPSNLWGIKFTRQLIYAIKEDKNGNIWIGLDGSDASVIYYRQQQRFNLLQAPQKYNSLVYSLAVNKNEKLYMACFHKGINVFNANGNWIKYIALPGMEEGTSLSIRPMAFIDSVHLVMKSVYGRLLVLNTNSGAIKDLSNKMTPFVNNDNFSFDAAMLQHGDNELLFTHGQYLLALKKQGKEFKLIAKDSLKPDQFINAVSFDQKNNILAGTIEGCYFKQNDHWQIIKGTEKYYIKCLTKSPSGEIWMGTTEGIFVYHSNDLVRSYTNKNGLLNDFIYGILFDKDGMAWYSSNMGLGCIQKDGKIYNFTEADGLQANEFDTDSYGISPNGKLYFGGVNGISSFMPFLNTSTSNISLNQISVNEQPILDTFTNKNSGKSLQLDYNQNSLAFDFSLGPFSETEKNNYQIKMDGLDTGWLNLGNQHTARYHLLPNNYTLKIRGRSNSNEWSPAFNLPISIKPAWWQTIFFKTLTAIFLLLLFSFFIWYFLNQRNKKVLQKLLMEQQILKERQRISSELHDNVGSRLTNIIAQLDYLEFVQKQKPELLASKLEILQQKSRETMTQLRESIWALNEGTMTLQTFSQKLLQYGMDIFTEESHINFNLQKSGNMNLKISAYQAVNLLRIFQEIFQNVQKHANASLVEAAIEVLHNKIDFSVIDNGIGFETNSMAPGNGIPNINRRIQDLGGKVSIKSKKSFGTEILFSIETV